MTTLETARNRVRQRLEDESIDPLWDDDEIDEGLRVALDEYNDWTLDHATVDIPASGGDRELDLPADLRRVIRVLGPRGNVIPRQTAPSRGRVAEDLAWDVWDRQLHFTSGLVQGDYRVRYLRARVLPDTDAGEMPVYDEHVSLLVLRSALWCLERRGIEDWKRGPIQQRYTAILSRTQREYAARWRSIMGSIRTSHVEVSG